MPAYPNNALSIVHAIVTDHAESLASMFYDVLLADEEATKFLSHSAVHDRLSKSLHNWMIDLFKGEGFETSAALRDQQKVIGEVHARIKIPIHLVMRGALVIKSRLADIIASQAADAMSVVEQVRLVNERIDVAVMLMSQSYMSGTTARARLDEAYRLFSLDQDVTAERESQRASLMEWSHRTLFSLLRNERIEGLARLSESPFGLWMRHRADFMFEKSPGLSDLNAAIQRIDSEILPQLEMAGTSANSPGALSQLQAAVDKISFLVSDLFQALGAIESGRDALTRALNRRFLPAIMGREITFANQHNSPLTVMMVDIDHFKNVNDQHGHQAGDTILSRVAQILMDNVRPSDFVFRYGGEEFLIILSETAKAGAQQIAERILAELSSKELEFGDGARLSVTASIGIAQHTGHPDQKYLIKDADEALYRAKSNGRNRIEFIA